MDSSYPQYPYTQNQGNQVEDGYTPLPNDGPPAPKRPRVDHRIPISGAGRQKHNASEPSRRTEEQISSDLEHQVRGLSQYNDSSTQQTSPSDQAAPGQTISTSTSPDTLTVMGFYKYGGETGTIPITLPQRGAKPGKMLGYNCDYCNNKKRKCPHDFPCGECMKDGQKCIPRTHKRTRPTELQEASQDQDELEATNEEGGNQEPPPADQEANNSPPPYKPGGYGPKKGPRDSMQNNIAPVVGKFQEWSNKRTKYNPFPSDIDAIREKIFKLDKPMLFNSQQYADYWPHITNIYIRSSKGMSVAESNGTTREIWECRNLHRTRPWAKNSQSKGLRNRGTKSHLLESDQPCQMRFGIVMYIKHANTDDEDHSIGLGSCRCVPEWMYIERRPKCYGLTHNHSMESSDMYKRCDAMNHFAKLKVEEGGYSFAAVQHWIQRKYGSITSQVKHLSKSDIANACRNWRVENQELELITEVPEPSAEEEERQKCLDLIDTTTVDGLRKAMREVCKQLPAAAAIAMPHLQAAQEPGTENVEGPSGAKILEGKDIKVPAPGFSARMFGSQWPTHNTIDHLPPPPPPQPQPQVLPPAPQLQPNSAHVSPSQHAPNGQQMHSHPHQTPNGPFQQPNQHPSQPHPQNDPSPNTQPPANAGQPTQSAAAQQQNIPPQTQVGPSTSNPRQIPPYPYQNPASPTTIPYQNNTTSTSMPPPPLPRQPYAPVRNKNDPRDVLRPSGPRFPGSNTLKSHAEVRPAWAGDGRQSGVASGGDGGGKDVPSVSTSRDDLVRKQLDSELDSG